MCYFSTMFVKTIFSVVVFVVVGGASVIVTVAVT